jgi:hypothetical protein
MANENERNREGGSNEIKKSLDYSRCGSHGISYPSGGECPACAREREQSRNS